MSAAVATHNPASSDRRKSCWLGTPEIYFRKTIDNSRLVKVEDPGREREMRFFGVALLCLFLLVMGYALQHFRAIEYGYKIEQAKAEQSVFLESNRELKLEESSLKDLERIETAARKLGMVPPVAGQVLTIESGNGDSTVPVMAKANPNGIMVVSLQQ